MASGPFSYYCLGLLSNCSRELSMPLELQQVTQGSFRVVVEPSLELQWGRSSLVVLCRQVLVYLYCVGGYSLVTAWGSKLVAVGGSQQIQLQKCEHVEQKRPKWQQSLRPASTGTPVATVCRYHLKQRGEQWLR